MRNHVIFMLSGYMKSGKDTVGDYLIKHFNFKRYAFADMLKDEVAEMYGIERQLLDSQSGKDSTVYNPFLQCQQTVREILIDHGQLRRSEKLTYWVDKVCAKITHDKEPLRVVITDWRFANEYETVRDTMQRYVVSTWRINRWPEPPLKDISELALDIFNNFDYVVPNTTTIADLQQYVKNLIYKNAVVPLLLLDVDDCLLKWVDAFKRYIFHTYEITCKSEYPSSWRMEGWLVNERQQVLNAEVIQGLVRQFNSSAHFGQLDAYEGAVAALHVATDLGFTIVAISSCADDLDAHVKRKANIISRFGDNTFTDVICLPLNHSKKECLAGFGKGIFLDDNRSHVDSAEEVGHVSFLMNREWNKVETLEKKYTLVNNWTEFIQILKDYVE